MDVLPPLLHRGQGVGVVLFLKWAFRINRLLTEDVLALNLQLLQEHLFVLVPLLEQQLIQLFGGWALALKQALGAELLPPGADHRTTAEEG